MDKVRVLGYITNYIYEAKDSLYKVCQLKQEDDKKITIVGNFPHLEDGIVYEFVGEYRITMKYGEQFFVESYSRSEAISKDGLVEYLSSERFVGIGKKTAEKIVDTLGLDALNKILSNKEVLKEVSGLNETKREIIYNVLKSQFLMLNHHIF